MADVHLLPTRNLSPSGLQRVLGALREAHAAGADLGSRAPHIQAAGTTLSAMARALREAARCAKPRGSRSRRSRSPSSSVQKPSSTFWTLPARSSGWPTWPLDSPTRRSSDSISNGRGDPAPVAALMAFRAWWSLVGSGKSAQSPDASCPLTDPDGGGAAAANRTQHPGSRLGHQFPVPCPWLIGDHTVDDAASVRFADPHAASRVARGSHQALIGRREIRLSAHPCARYAGRIAVRMMVGSCPGGIGRGGDLMAENPGGLTQPGDGPAVCHATDSGAPDTGSGQ